MGTDTCYVCNHPERELIEKMMIGGVSFRTLAEKFPPGSRMTFQRHKARHLPKQLIQGTREHEAAMADSLLVRIEGLYDKALRIMAAAEADKKYSPAIAAIKEARSSLELVARMVGELKTGVSINVVYNQEFVQIRQEIVQALRPYPEARRAVLKALEDAEVIALGNEE